VDTNVSEEHAGIFRVKVCRRRVGSDKFLLALASTTILGAGSHGTHDHIFLPPDSGSVESIGLYRPVARKVTTTQTHGRGQGNEAQSGSV
jgi:hypothetical protein